MKTYTIYSKTAQKALKQSQAGLFIEQDQDGTIYACNGFILLKCTPGDYDAIIRPLTGRDAGNYRISKEGDAVPEIAGRWRDFWRQALEEQRKKPEFARLEIFPGTIDGAKPGEALRIMYNRKAGTISAFNSLYTGIFAEPVGFWSSSSVGATFAGQDENDPRALILPVRYSGSDRAKLARYFEEAGTDASARAAAEDHAQKLEQERDWLRRELERMKAAAEKTGEKAENSRQDAPKQPRRYKLPTEPQKALKQAILSRSETARELEHLREKITRQADEKRALIDEAERWREKYDQAAGLVKELTETAQQQRAKVQELEAAHEGDADAAAIIRELRERVKELETARPAKPAGVVPEAVQAIIDKFRAIPGAAVTVKGAASAAPVVWITGGDPEQITAAGGIWSAKRAAYWCKA